MPDAAPLPSARLHCPMPPTLVCGRRVVGEAPKNRQSSSSLSVVALWLVSHPLMAIRSMSPPPLQALATAEPSASPRRRAPPPPSTRRHRTIELWLVPLAEAPSRTTVPRLGQAHPSFCCFRLAASHVGCPLPIPERLALVV
jgi:hypothetical protein